MYTAYVLVKNLTSNSNELNFSKFKFTKIPRGDVEAFEKYKKIFSTGLPLYGDWIYERCYTNVDSLEIIPNDVEDTLLLLRLFKVGDLGFIQHYIRGKDGTNLRQLPYRVMADIRPLRKYEMQNDECSEFDRFASEIMSQNNWGSTWFQTARRFFLYGSSKYFNPRHNEVDRIVDFMIAMESILVPERDFVGRRLRERAVKFLRNINMNYSDTKRLLKDFYDVRSTIVHGSDISSFNNFIINKHIEFESIVREIIKEAIKALPADDGNREAFLRQLFEVSDQDKAKKVYDDFCAIKDTDEKKRCFNRISKRLEKSGSFTENGKRKTENRL